MTLIFSGTETNRLSERRPNKVRIIFIVVWKGNRHPQESASPISPQLVAHRIAYTQADVINLCGYSRAPPAKSSNRGSEVL